jgi:hypothetical protein
LSKKNKKKINKAKAKVECSEKRLMVCWKRGICNSRLYKIVTLERFHEAPHTVAQLYAHGLTNGILRVFNTILYENEFQNYQIFQQTVFFPSFKTFEQVKNNFCFFTLGSSGYPNDSHGNQVDGPNKKNGYSLP